MSQPIATRSGGSLVRLALLALLLAGLSALLPGPASALPPVGETPYSGRFSITAGDQSFGGRLYHSRDAERRDMTVQGSEQILILRPLQAEALMIMPANGMALRMPLPPDPGLAATEAFARLNPEMLGEGRVSGEPTTIYQTSGDLIGRFWITEDGIVMRMEVEGDQGRFVMVLEELRRGEQDPALFELPPGIQVVDGPPAAQ